MAARPDTAEDSSSRFSRGSTTPRSEGAGPGRTGFVRPSRSSLPRAAGNLPGTRSAERPAEPPQARAHEEGTRGLLDPRTRIGGERFPPAKKNRRCLKQPDAPTRRQDHPPIAPEDSPPPGTFTMCHCQTLRLTPHLSTPSASAVGDKQALLRDRPAALGAASAHGDFLFQPPAHIRFRQGGRQPGGSGIIPRRHDVATAGIGRVAALQRRLVDLEVCREVTGRYRPGPSESFHERVHTRVSSHPSCRGPPPPGRLRVFLLSHPCRLQPEKGSPEERAGCTSALMSILHNHAFSCNPTLTDSHAPW